MLIEIGGKQKPAAKVFSTCDNKETRAIAAKGNTLIRGFHSRTCDPQGPRHCSSIMRFLGQISPGHL